MKPDRLSAYEVLPAAIRLMQRRLLASGSPDQQRTLTKVVSFLAKAYRKIAARWPVAPSALYVGLLPPRDAGDWRAWGLELRLRREESGLTRVQLAALSGVANSTIRNVETGRHRPRRAVVMRLQAVPALGLPSAEGEGITPPAPPTPQTQSGAARFSSCCWFAPELDTRRISLDMMQRFNGLGGNIEPAFLYTDQASAAAWRAVTAQAEYAQRRLPMDELADETGVHLDTLPADVIGLGAGEATAEVSLVQALLKQHCRDVRLFLIDSSQPLLSAGYRHAAQALHPSVGVLAIQGNFHHLPSYPSLFATARRRVLCMFGDTFCCLENELLFLRTSLRTLTPGDLFILDVPQQLTPTDQLIEILRTDPTALRSASAILSRLHEFLVGPFLRYVRGIQNVWFSREIDRHAGLIPGSYAVHLLAHVQSTSGPERVFSVGGISKRYEPTGLGDCLLRLGFQEVGRWSYPDQRHPRLLFLFRKNDRFF